MKLVLASSVLFVDTLENGFWPSLMFGLAFKDRFLDDSTIWKEYLKDVPFIVCRHNCPFPSF